MRTTNTESQPPLNRQHNHHHTGRSPPFNHHYTVVAMAAPGFVVVFHSESYNGTLYDNLSSVLHVRLLALRSCDLARKISGDISVHVQFFGTHDFARYLIRQNLPKSMLQLRNGVGTYLEGDGKTDEGSGNSKKTCLSTELVETKFKGTKSGPFIVGDLEVLKLGKMVKDLNCVNDDGSIWPLGYTATRKFPSLADPSVCSVYKMEVLRDTVGSFKLHADNSFYLTVVATSWYARSFASLLSSHLFRLLDVKLFHAAEAASESFFKSGTDTSVEEASNAMALDGIIFEGARVKVRRPSDYNPSLAATLGPSQPNPNLNLGAVNLTPGGLEGPDRIFVGGLPYYFTDAQVRELLESFVALRGFNLVKDRETGNSKGYTFYVYQDLSVTDIASVALNGIKMGDKTLTVRRANQGQTQPKLRVYCYMHNNKLRCRLMLQPAPIGPPPTKVLSLTQVVTEEELVNDEDYEDIEDMKIDVKNSVSNFKILKTVSENNEAEDEDDYEDEDEGYGESDEDEEEEEEEEANNENILDQLRSTHSNAVLEKGGREQDDSQPGNEEKASTHSSPDDDFSGQHSTSQNVDIEKKPTHSNGASEKDEHEQEQTRTS
ncbi:splicing factor U2af large subunit B [Tanacetum coccineum]